MLADITMSYGHAISTTVTSACPTPSVAEQCRYRGLDTTGNGDVLHGHAHYGSGSTVSHALTSVYSGGSWSTQDIDTASRTGYKPSMRRQGRCSAHRLHRP